MSAQTVESVLSKAMSDAKFADALFADPEKALAGYDLTAVEIANLKAMSRADFEKQYASGTADERKSFGIHLNHNETALNVL